MGTTKVLVTGVAGYWGYRVAQKLAADPQYHVLGLDTVQPRNAIPGLDFVQADIRNPLLVELFRAEQVEVVCHLAFKESARRSETAFDHNVMGTMKVLGACAESSVKKIILMSSTAVYGADFKNPAYLTEESPLAGSRDYGSIRDLIEIEAFCNGFRGQFPNRKLTILRFPNIVGPTVDSPMTKFLQEPLSPSLLGFDPMMQLIHEDDVVNALVHVVQNDYAGVFNVAAEDLMPLSKVTGLAGKMRIPVFHLFAYWGYSMMGGSGLRLSKRVPIELDYIRYRWVGDLGKMRDELQFSPAFTAEVALREFDEQNRVKQYVPEAITKAYDVDRLRSIIERRKKKTDTEPDGVEANIPEDTEGENDE
jgi:UDP-glucose 4-epimerase